MKKTNALAFKLPLILGLALTLGGCYTMLKHPSADDLTAGGHETDYRYSDCASCHYEGFSQPMFPDPYGYMAPWMVSYYGCPWWLPDCGYGYGGSSGGWGGYAGGDDEVGPDDGRNIGGRGSVRGGTGIPRALPSVTPPSSGSGPAAPSVRPNESSPGDSTPPAASPAPGQSRTNKHSESSSSSSSSSKDTGKKDSRSKDKPKQ